MAIGPILGKIRRPQLTIAAIGTMAVPSPVREGAADLMRGRPVRLGKFQPGIGKVEPVHHLVVLVAGRGVRIA